MIKNEPDERFRYLRDELFLFCLIVYLLNRLAESFNASHWILQFYLNDLLCLGIWMPVVVGGLRLLGLRHHDCPPTQLEMTICFAVWAFAFEVFLPQTELFHGVTIPDPNDILAYALGGLIAHFYWNVMMSPNASPHRLALLKR